MKKVLRWLIFGAVVSLIPLVYAYADLRLKGESASLVKVIGNGELLVIVWVLSASAVGELFGSNETRALVKIVFGGLAFIIIILSALFFSSIAEARSYKGTIDSDFVVKSSICLYLMSLAPCAICLVCTDN